MGIIPQRSQSAVHSNYFPNPQPHSKKASPKFANQEQNKLQLQPSGNLNFHCRQNIDVEVWKPQGGVSHIQETGTIIVPFKG